MQRIASIFLLLLMGPLQLAAALHSGSVRAADHFIPGATVTARQGSVKLVAYTDEGGQYSLVLTPGTWEISVEMLGFTTQIVQVTGDKDTTHDWALEIPRIGEAAPVVVSSNPPPAPPTATATAASASSATATQAAAPVPAATAAAPTAAKTPEVAKAQTPAAQTPAQTPHRRPTRPQSPQGFQSASVRATEQGQQALSTAAAGAAPAPGDSDDATLFVQGSTSGGLAQSSDDEQRRQRYYQRGGGGGDNPSLFAGGFGDPNGGGMVMPPGMSNGSGDSLGLGGFGAGAIQGGFGADSGSMPGMDGGRGGRGGPPGGGGGGGGRGGPPGPGGRHRPSSTHGPYNGQYNSFGNRHRNDSDYSGSIYLSMANSYLNAAPFSLNGQTAAKPSYDQARFGLNLGGPVVIPKIVNLPRWSFNVSYSGTVSRNPVNMASSVPTDAERNGDFSGLTSTIYNNGVPFNNNTIPASLINPTAKALLALFPQPTYEGVVQNYRLQNAYPNNSENLGLRLNAPLTNWDRITVNYQMQTRDSQSEQLFGYRDPSNGHGLSVALGWSHSFAPRFNNSATITLSRNYSKNVPFFAYNQNIAGTELGIGGQVPINYGPPSLSFTNFGGLSDGTASVSRPQTVSFSDGITYVVKRRHNLTFGYIYRRLQQNTLSYPNARGSYTFSGLETSALVNGQPLANTGFDFADFLLGAPQSSSLRLGANNNYFRGWSTSTYAQDDWRVNHRLSINVGIRYEYFSPYTELYGHLVNLLVNPEVTQVSVIVPGSKAPPASEFPFGLPSGYTLVPGSTAGLPSSLVKPDDNNFSPRFGFAFRPARKHSTVIRGGYSIFYSGSAYGQIASQLASQPPFAQSVSVTTTTSNPLTLTAPIGIPTQTITNSFAINPNYRLAYAQNWVTAVQHTLPHNLLVELEYIGNKGTDLGVVDQPNRAQPGVSLLNAQNELPIANASSFNYETSGANSSYEAGQVRLTQRFNRGLSFVALYTYAKAIDDASSFSGPGGTTVQFINNLHLERGLSTFDQRHRLSLTFLGSSPVGVHGFMRNSGWKTKLLTGWFLAGTFTANTGTPLTARVAGNLSNVGGTAAFGTGRAQATGESIDEGDYPYFNLNAFTTPLPGTYGDAGRDTIPGPLVTSFNASLNRAFRFGESRRQLQLRISANNALNHVQITGFGTTINATTYGLATAASATRTVSLLLRFSF